MKRLFLTLALTAGICAGLGAQSFDYLTVRTADGGERSLPVDGLRLTFENGRLVARTAATTDSYPLADLSVMFFASQPTAIASLQAVQPAPVFRDGRLTVSAPAGTGVSLYAADGRLVARFVKAADGSESFAPTLTRGIYVVNVNGRTSKFLAR